MNNNRTQLGYFISLDLWQDALELLNFQIQQKKTNRHFNTLSMFYYEKLDTQCVSCAVKEYFDIKVSSSLFYGLKNEFTVISHVVPKSGLGLRDYSFFSYPMRAIYYAVGLYLLKLSQEFLNETYRKVGSIESFYGGKIHYKSDKLQIAPQTIYYRNYHEQFKLKIKNEAITDSKDKIILKLDIENYFNELSIPKLLHLLNRFVKPSTQVNMNYDIFTRDQIISFFQFIMNKSIGIPQADNNILSNFIGYLYLTFGDLFVDDILTYYKESIDLYKIIRYTDDIYISITYKNIVGQELQGSLTHTIASRIAEVLYSQLGLKLNLKTKLYRLSRVEEKEELLKNIHRMSPSNEYADSDKEDEDKSENTEQSLETPQDKLDKIFLELRKIKESRIEDYFIQGNLAQEEILQQILEKSVEQILDQSSNREKARDIFKNFNFDLIKVQPLEILIFLLKDQTAIDEFKSFCLRKTIVTTGDADLIIKFLCQTSFRDQDLLLKLRQNTHMSHVIDIFLNAKLNCDKPGYYELTCMQMKKLSQMPNVLEQTRLRVLSERNESYSVALNHLVNEIYAICINQERANKKDYDVNSVVKFLHLKGIQHEVCTKIRNLFDRRNSNRVSHPDSGGGLAWDVTREEYLDYHEHVGKCLDVIL